MGKYNMIIHIENKENFCAFIDNAAKEKYLHDLQRIMVGEDIHLIGFYCSDEYITLICVETDEEAIIRVIHAVNLQYCSYYKRVMEHTFIPQVNFEYIQDMSKLKDRYYNIMYGKKGSVFYADYQWSSISVIGGSNSICFLKELLDTKQLVKTFGADFSQKIIIETIIASCSEEEEDRKVNIAQRVIWKLTGYSSIEEFKKRATHNEKCMVTQALFCVHDFSYAQITQLLGYSKSTIYRYMRG